MDLNKFLSSTLPKAFFGGVGIGLVRYSLLGTSRLGGLIFTPLSWFWGAYCVYEDLNPEDKAKVDAVLADLKKKLKGKASHLNLVKEEPIQ